MDFAFVIDATGSMKDALAAASDRVVHIARTARDNYPSNFDFQFAAVCYRDPIEDGIASQSFGFTSSAESLASWLSTIKAEGGGDHCEDWSDGMRLLCQLPWRPNALRCVFWIADAPAHGLRYWKLLGLLILCIPGELDNHSDKEGDLEPWVVKLAKMNVMFVGLDLHIAFPTFHEIQIIYNLAGGPSFTYERFARDGNDDIERIAKFLQEHSMELVNQTVLQTCAYAVGAAQPSAKIIDTKPAGPQIRGGSTIDVPSDIAGVVPEFSDLHYEGCGACSQVYTAIYRPTGAKVAVKQMKAIDEDTRRYCRREIAAHKAFTHPTCLGFTMSKEEREFVLLVTPYMENSDLQKALKLAWSGTPYVRWPTMQVLCLFGIAFGMEYIHAKGFVHRDLKPANIFFDSNMFPVIGDFGLTRSIRDAGGKEAESPTMAIGTPLHMAPELYTDDYGDQYSQKVDVYSYAVLLYSLFCEHPERMLSDGQSAPKSKENLMMRIGRGTRFQRVPGIPNPYWDLITNGWSHNPATRCDFKEIVDELLAHVGEFLIEGCEEDVVRRYIQDMTPRRPK
jgi:hypothetical protein